MSEIDDETRAAPGRMASAEYGPDYADTEDEFGGRSAYPPPHGGWAAPPPGIGQLLTETRPFFLTTEFAAAVVALAALAVTAASSDSLDAGSAWPLATAIVAAFVFSRGFAKAGAASRSWDPRELLRPSQAGEQAGAGDEKDDDNRVASSVRHDDDEEETLQMSTMSREQYGTQAGGMYGPSYGYGRGFGMRQAFPVETKPFFLTSEFWGSVALIIGLAIAAGTSEQIDARLFWTLATAITIGYVVSRGIAKSGTKSRSWDPREDLMQGARERITSRQGDGS